MFSPALNLKSHFPSTRRALNFHPHRIQNSSSPTYPRNRPPSRKPSVSQATIRTGACLNNSTPKPQTPSKEEILKCSPDGSSRVLVLGAASLGLVAVLLLGIDRKDALALGPDGPLVEEFWDNMRRYGLYILTVSTGVVAAIVEPIVELLKNPITAILIITIVVGSGYLLSQVLSLMVGITDFAYDYAN